VKIGYVPLVLLGVMTDLACDELRRVNRTAVLAEMPPRGCVAEALRGLPWVEDTSTSEQSFGTTVTIMTRPGVLPREVFLKPDTASGVVRFRLTWFEMNGEFRGDELRQLRAAMDAAYAAIRARCPGFPDPSKVREECDPVSACQPPRGDGKRTGQPKGRESRSESKERVTGRLPVPVGT
jgi:hypothetical protein